MGEEDIQSVLFTQGAVKVGAHLLRSVGPHRFVTRRLVDMRSHSLGERVVESESVGNYLVAVVKPVKAKNKIEMLDDVHCSAELFPGDWILVAWVLRPSVIGQGATEHLEVIVAQKGTPLGPKIKWSVLSAALFSVIVAVLEVLESVLAHYPIDWVSKSCCEHSTMAGCQR